MIDPGRPAGVPTNRGKPAHRYPAKGKTSVSLFRPAPPFPGGTKSRVGRSSFARWNNSKGGGFSPSSPPGTVFP